MQALLTRPFHWVGHHERIGQVVAGLCVATITIGLTAVLQSRGILIGTIGVIVVIGSAWFAATKHTLLALALFMLYLGLLDGYLKLATGQAAVSIVRDILLYALVVGLLVRAQVTGREWVLPPLAAWPIAFVVLICAQLFNPNAGTLAHSLGGLRQHLEFIPLFFLAFAYLRTVRSLRLFVIILLIVATANGIVGYVQFGLSPEQFAQWGPGYQARVNGTDAFTRSARTFSTEGGQERVRPFGLGSEAGSGGLFGALAIAGAFALCALVGRLRYQLLAVALAIGATVAILTSQGRGAVVCAVITVIAFALMTATSRKRTATVMGIAVAGLVCYAVISSVVTDQGASSFRYKGLDPASLIQTTNASRKGFVTDTVWNTIRHYPLGAGLAVAGPAAGQPGGSPLTNTLNAESEFSFMALEGGVPGLLLIVGFTLTIAYFGFTRIRREPDPDARLLLAAIVAPAVGMLALYYPSPITATVPTGPYLWTAGGIVSFWLITRQRELAMARVATLSPFGKPADDGFHGPTAGPALPAAGTAVRSS